VHAVFQSTAIEAVLRQLAVVDVIARRVDVLFATGGPYGIMEKELFRPFL
jgi:hypothetical protein